MAFIFEADRTVPTQNLNPGPGQYIAHREYQSNKGYAPFLSTVERGTGKKITKESAPGPGSYEPMLQIENSLKPKQPFYSTLAPEKEIVETANHSNVFKSKTKRFEYRIDTELPGPGTYYKDPGMGKALSTSAIASYNKSNSFPIQKLTKENKANVPSIPSFTHSYGYSETEDHKLTLNKNPLIEIQQFVGPGYYDTVDEFTNTSTKGSTWYKSTSKRFDANEKKFATHQIGPGTYNATNGEGAAPLYKTKASSSFLSSTGRVTFGKTKPKHGVKLQNYKSAEHLNFAIGVETPDNGIPLGHVAEEMHTDESVPGPGHYHDEFKSSSLKMNYKPAKFQFFGSGSERFQDGSDLQLGPGEYNLPDHLRKKRSKVAGGFQSTETRLKGLQSTALGPGVYPVKNTIVERIADKGKKGYLGSFGSTEIRFKAPKAEVSPLEPAKVFGDPVFTRPPIQEEPKKPSPFFVSPSKKNTVQRDEPEIPPPGSYNTNYYDIAKKVSQTGSEFFTAKNVPFKSSAPRFKSSNQNQREKEEPVDQYLIQKHQTVMKPGMKTAQSAAFSSKTQRSLSCMPKNAAANPGGYQTNLQDMWNKKTFNIKYIDENK